MLAKACKERQMSYRRFTFEQISARFIYEPSTGRLVRRLRNGSVRELTVAVDREKWDQGTAANNIGFGGYRIQVTHIMFMLVTKRWPKPGYVMDHRNGDVFDCRWVNLRELTPQQSRWSRQGWAGGDGLERGVSLDRGKYRVGFTINGARKYFGSYGTKEEANSVASKVIREVQGEYGYAASRRPRSWRRI
jgi:hypothetical protein